MTFPTFYDFVHFWDSLEIWAAAKAKKKIFIRNFAHLYLFVRERQWALTKPLFLSKSIKTIEENAQRFVATKRNASMFEVLPNYLCGRFDRFLIPVFIGLVNSTSAV